MDARDMRSQGQGKAIRCFALKGSRCTALDVLPSYDRCMACKFRKEEREVTGGRRYPYNEKRYGRMPYFWG